MSAILTANSENLKQLFISLTYLIFLIIYRLKNYLNNSDFFYYIIIIIVFVIMTVSFTVNIDMHIIY